MNRYALLVAAVLVVSACKSDPDAMRRLARSPALFGREVTPELSRLVEKAAGEDASGLTARQRIVLQNDVWGWIQRTEDSPPVATKLLRALAVDDDAMLGGLDEVPTHAAIAGMTERTSDLVSLSHERLYGLRRLFRIYVSKDRRALVSQLVAIDGRGRARLTNVIGDIELLEFATSAPVADRVPEVGRVFHLDRSNAALVEVDRVEHVPDVGANGFLLELDEPVPLSNFPCARCHDDAQQMSLPVEGDPKPRLARLLSEVVVP